MLFCYACTCRIFIAGLERSKEVARELVAEAKAALAPYGDKAAPLNGLADYIINRKN